MGIVERRALVVVGGGVAGVAAALTAQRAGLETCLVERRSAVRDAGELETCLDTVCWGIWGHELALVGPDGCSRVVVADQVILATGAYERPVAFPGWTLPGVMTARGAERLLEQGVMPGMRVVVAGYGRWVIEAAEALRASGVHVVDVVDASAGRMVVRAEGDSTVERVRIHGVDADWYPRRGGEHAVQADALVLAYGLLPENQLARLAGCEHAGSHFVSPRTVRDAWMRTSVPGVLVAGAASGIVDETAAAEQGRLAGHAAAVDAGLLAESVAPVQAWEIDDAPRAGLYALATDDTVVCRCEDVTAGQIAERIFAGSLEPGPVIAESRAAMGRCQGRNCASQIAGVIARRTGAPIDRIPPTTARPPVWPVPIGALAERPPVFEAD